MSAFLSEIVLGLSINLASNLIGDKKVKRDDKKAIEKIRLIISDFNRRYDDTEVDSYAFQKFLDSSDVVDKIYTRVFESYKAEVDPIIDYKKSIAKYAIEEANQYYERYSKRIRNEEVFYDYFYDLIESLISIRASILSFESSAQTAIITEKIDVTKHEMKEALEIQFAKMREDNIFADDKINEIIDLISLKKYKQAEKELSEIFESFQLLSKSQRELIFYQRARILINTAQLQDLPAISSKIERINGNSKYIAEINYYIACENKDAKQLEESIRCFEKHKYSVEKIILKRAYFEMVSGNFELAMEMITENGELLNDLQENHEAHYYYGNVLIRIGENEKAYNQFCKAYELYKNIVYKYNSLISKSQILFNDKGNMISVSRGFLDEVTNTINDLKNVRYIIDYFSYEEIKEYWTVLINLVLIINPKQALREFSEVYNKFDEDKLIKSIKAEVYVKNQMYSEAREILEELWSFIPGNTFNFFFILAKEEDWKDILFKYNQIEDSKIKEHPGIKIFYIKAKSVIEGYNSVRDEVVRLSEFHADSAEFIMDGIKIVLENQDEETLVKMLDILTLNKDTMYEMELKVIGELLNAYFKFEKTRNLLEEHIHKSEVLLQVYVRTFDHLDEHTELTRIANEKAKALYNKGCRNKVLLRFKAQTEMVLGIPRKVIQTLEEYKNLFGIDDYYAYYYVASKIEKREFEGLGSETEFLLNTDNASNHQLIAMLKAKQGMWEEAQRIALSALYLSHDNLGKEVLMNYISMYFTNIEKEREEVNLVEVIPNSIVTLKSDDKVKNIAIHNNQSIITESGESKFGCENYHIDDATSLILISLGKKGDIVTLDDGEYEIVNIVNLYLYFNHFCLSILQKDYPDHDYFITNSAPTTEELIEEMKQTMEMVNKSKNKQLNLYNFGMEIGMPISFLSGKNIDDYSEMIISLLNQKNQHFYVGELSMHENREYVLSLSSIIILATFGLLDKLEQLSAKCVITTDVEKSIREGMKEAQKHTKITSGMVSLNEEGQLSFYSYNEEDRKKRKAFWTNMMLNITKIKKEEVKIDDNELYEIFAKYLLDEDVSSIELSRKSRKVLICDDLFIRKLHHGVTNTSDTTNIIGLIVSEGLATFEELIDLILELVKCKYLYPLNTSLIYEFLSWILSIQDEDTRSLNFDKLKEIYKHIYDEVSGQHYIIMHDEFVREASNNGIPAGWIYELVREPFNLKPLNEFVKEKSQGIIREMFDTEGTKLNH